MKHFAEALMTDLDYQLSQLRSTDEDGLENLEASIDILIKGLERLRQFYCKYRFGSKSEEVHFFKSVKPQLSAKLIYYHETYRILATLPTGSIKAKRKHFENELARLKRDFAEHADFYRYYRSGSCHLDHSYFLKGGIDIKLGPDCYYLQADHSFSTSHDFRAARFLANEMLAREIQRQSHNLQGSAPENLRKSSRHRWTGPKVALVELLYALHAEGVVNNGSADLKEIAAILESAFNVDLGQYHRSFLEIRARKAERTRFLSGLRERLLIRMDEADEA